MLVWSLSGRALIWAFAALLIGVFFVAPLAVILAGELRRSSGTACCRPASRSSIIATPPAAPRATPCTRASSTGLVASLLALVTGAWAALALRARTDSWAPALGLLFFIPSAVPSVSVGLGLLVAFSQRPLLLNGTTAIVVHRPFRADLRLRLRQHLGGPFAHRAGLRGGRLLPRRASGLSALATSRCRWSRPISSPPSA